MSSEYGYYLGHEQKQEQALAQQWELEPIQAMSMTVGGIEIFERMTIEEGETIEKFYIELREDIVNNPDRTTSVAATAQSGVAKGTFLASIFALVQNDKYLHEKLKEKNVKLRVIIPQIALYCMAAKLPVVKKSTPQFAVPQTFEFHTGTNEEYSRASQLMWHDIQLEIEEAQKSSKEGKLEKLLILMETPGPTAYPTTKDIPTQVKGKDRGCSTIYNVSLHESTRGGFFFVVIKRDKKVTLDTTEWRAKISSDDINPDKVFIGPLKVKFTHPKLGEVFVDTLPREEQMIIIQFLRLCMASPKAIENVDNELYNEIIPSLYEQGELESSTLESYYSFIAKKLGIKIYTVINHHYNGEKTYDLDYLLNSLAIQRHPSLIRKFARIIKRPTL